MIYSTAALGIFIYLLYCNIFKLTFIIYSEYNNYTYYIVVYVCYVINIINNTQTNIYR